MEIESWKSENRRTGILGKRHSCFALRVACPGCPELAEGSEVEGLVLSGVEGRGAEVRLLSALECGHSQPMRGISPLECVFTKNVGVGGIVAWAKVAAVGEQGWTGVYPERSRGRPPLCGQAKAYPCMSAPDCQLSTINYRLLTAVR